MVKRVLYYPRPYVCLPCLGVSLPSILLYALESKISDQLDTGTVAIRELLSRTKTAEARTKERKSMKAHEHKLSFLN